MMINFYVWWFKSKATITNTIPDIAIADLHIFLNEEWFDDLEIDEQITIAKHWFTNWCTSFI